MSAGGSTQLVWPQQTVACIRQHPLNNEYASNFMTRQSLMAMPRGNERSEHADAAISTQWGFSLNKNGVMQGAFRALQNLAALLLELRLLNKKSAKKFLRALC